MAECRSPVKQGVVVYGPAGSEAFWVPVAFCQLSKVKQQHEMNPDRLKFLTDIVAAVCVEPGALHSAMIACQ